MSDFEMLVKQNQSRIFRLARGMLHDRDLADDVAQETFVRAFRFYGTFANRAAFSTWLHRIALNLCFDARRKAARSWSESGGEIEDERADPRPPPDHLAETRELSGLVDEALGDLSPDHRAILLLREVEGLSYEEIAAVLRIPKGTVMSRLFHARSNLQRIVRLRERAPRRAA